MAGTQGGNIFSNLSNALLGPQMAPWWALALGGTAAGIGISAGA